MKGENGGQLARGTFKGWEQPLRDVSNLTEGGNVRGRLLSVCLPTHATRPP